MTSQADFQHQIKGLPTIDLQALLVQEPAETAKLLDAAKQYGFFYLDFRMTPDSETFLSLVDQIYRFEEQLFSLPQEHLMKYDVDELGYMKLNGYKPKGRNFGGLNGGRDGFESYAVPKDGVLGLGDKPFPRPPLFGEHMPMLITAMRTMQDATLAVNAGLSRALGLPAGGKFEDFNKAGRTSPCILRLLKYHALPDYERGPSQTPHTDLGSLTILFTKQPGLQVLTKGANEWEYVEPRAGHAIVNVGDGMSMMTNGLFHSSLHRVGPPPNQPMATRYSFAYLQRAEEHTSLTGLQSPLIPAAGGSSGVLTSGQWLHEKFSMLRAKTHNREKQWILTGR